MSILLIFLSKTLTLLLPTYSIATPQELVLPCEKKHRFLINLVISFHQLKMNGFLAKAKIHQSLNCFLNIQIF